MIRGLDPVLQSIIASIFTWGITALGASFVFFIHPSCKKFLDMSLGFAAGVMMAASFWSLLSPAIEISRSLFGGYVIVPVAVGFSLGSFFVLAADRLVQKCILSPTSIVELMAENLTTVDPLSGTADHELQEFAPGKEYVSRKEISQWNERTMAETSGSDNVDREMSREKKGTRSLIAPSDREGCDGRSAIAIQTWRRVLLLVIAVTVHNIPEGFAVGIGFGSIGNSPKATFESAFNLAVGIGLQNFPEGLAVSLPLAALGQSKWKAFMYGQLSGMVEPFAAIVGAVSVVKMRFILPFALSFAAGAMIYVVVDDLIPEAQRNGNGRSASSCAIIGFLVMMCLDVAFG